MRDPLILVYNQNPEPIADYLRRHDCPGRVVTASHADDAQKAITEAEIVFAWRLPSPLYAAARHLRWIQSMGAGVEDIVVNPHIGPEVLMTRIVGQFGVPIAEYVFAELLYHVRNLSEARRLQHARRWQGFSVDSLKGRTIGVAGLGSIGKEIVRKARVFDMRVVGLSRHQPVAGLVDRAFNDRQWIQFVQDLDYLVLALPLSAQTARVVDDTILGYMKPHAIIVNVGRGRVIHQSALIQALYRGDIGGAILDVFEDEPLPLDNPLWGLPNVVVTPHISGPSVDEEVAAFFLRNLKRFLGGEPLEGVVDRERGY
ncbi:D-2-hydroxyacid dehydrogenase [Sulfobacillus sp. hq2]|uniref:D-2-hydroxyacid dehydrogenase n=1 Tax=Sulfobacillus TaxID=28033 RepID=UPI000CD20EF2|nr:D-2-hydroxyacid dehydrogenase [Sulfobacillus sp. hq2]POB10989.1 D-2-hydroxyacid dehydrogenase [Sulfobacillus sp. hq2]